MCGYVRVGGGWVGRWLSAVSGVVCGLSVGFLKGVSARVCVALCVGVCEDGWWGGCVRRGDDTLRTIGSHRKYCEKYRHIIFPQFP